MACDMYFAEYPKMTEGQKVLLTIQCLKGPAMDWAPALWKTAGHLARDHSAFVQQFRLVFQEHPEHGRSSGQRLLQLDEGTPQYVRQYVGMWLAKTPAKH